MIIQTDQAVCVIDWYGPGFGNWLWLSRSCKTNNTKYYL